MYCPKCSSLATEGQRFCRQCGTNLGIIVDAMDGKRGPLDFEKLKVDLKDLGSSLRTGFEHAQQEIKKQHKMGRQQKRAAMHKWRSVAQAATETTPENNCAVAAASERQPFTYVKKSRQPGSARYHLQQATLKILSGGAGAAVWYYLLHTAASSGLLESLQRIILEHQPNLTGFVPVIQMLWILGLVPVAQGVGHLVAATFAPSEKQLAAAQMPVALPQINQPVSSITRDTNEIKQDYANVYSVTEEPTVLLGQPERKRQAS